MTPLPEDTAHPFPESWEASPKPHVDLDGGERAGGPEVSSDERLRSAVCELLKADSRVDASTVAVTVQAGEVTLAGAVHDARAARAAVELARRAPGVLAVHDEILIRL